MTELVCIQCPIGCQLEVEQDSQGSILQVKGYQCNRGEVYAREELIAPKRIVTSTVRLENGKSPLVSVKTAAGIPKETIFEVMKEINDLCVQAPVSIGDVLLENIAGTGVNLIATQNNK